MSIIIYDLARNNSERIYQARSGNLYRGGPELMEQHVLNPEYAFCRRLVTELGTVVGYHLQPFSCIPGTQIGEVLLLEERLPHDHVVRVRMPIDGNNLIYNPQTDAWDEIEDFEVTSRQVPKRVRFACTADFVREWVALAPEQIAQFLEQASWPHLDAGATWGWSLEALSQSWVNLDLEDRVLSLYGLAKGAHFQHFGEFNSAFVADGKNWPTPDRALQTLSSEDTSGNEAFDPKSDLDVAGAVNTLSNWALLTKLCSITADQAAALEKNLTPLGVLSPPATRFQTKSRAWRGQTESGSAVRCLGSMTFGDKILSFVNVSGEPARGERITINGQDVGHLACTLWKMNDHWAYLQPEEQRSIALVLT